MRYVDPESWAAEAPLNERVVVAGVGRVARPRTPGDPAAPPPMGAPHAGYAVLCDAPGSYVRQE